MKQYIFMLLFTISIVSSCTIQNTQKEAGIAGKIQGIENNTEFGQENNTGAISSDSQSALGVTEEKGLCGIDADNNGIRDDIESFIGTIDTDSDTKNKLLDIAKIYCAQLNYKLTGKKEDVSYFFSDNLFEILESVDRDLAFTIREKSFDTTERKERGDFIVAIAFNSNLAIRPPTCSLGEKAFGILPVPPNPDTIKNQETLIGIDVNGNYVRDDIERMLMCIADNLPDYLRLLELARLEESIFYIANETIPTREDLLFLVSKGLCTSFELYSNYANKDIFYEQFIKEMLLDTDIRREYYREKNQNMRGGYAGSELTSCEEL